MSLKCGVVGLPNVGKSTLFNALSGNKVDVANFPFCTIEPNVGVVYVPDDRLHILEKLVAPQRMIPTMMEFVDIAGLVKGASKGEGLGNQFLASIREMDAVAHVIRCFDDENVIHVNGCIDPVGDKEIIDTELQIKDLEIVERKIEKFQRMSKGGNNKLNKDIDCLNQYANLLRRGKNAKDMDNEELSHAEVIQDISLLTNKPVIYVANVDEKAVSKGINHYVETLATHVGDSPLIVVSAALEAQIADFKLAKEKEEFMHAYDIKQSGLEQLITSAYAALGLITYFTAGEKEVKAWTVRRGATAPQAAGVIHSDFEKGFIRAEVIKLADYQNYKTETACREAGKLFVEGKEYVVEDGDVVHFRFNV